MKRLIGWCFLGVCAFLGGVVGVALAPHVVSPVLAQPPSGLSATPGGDVAKLGERFELVARKVSPAVVAIEASKPAVPGKSKSVEESGSGVIFRPEANGPLLVLTNNHVITGAPADKITISLSDGKLLHPGKVWADPESDVALLRLDTSEALPTVPLGDSDGLRVGQWVLAFGSPFGLNQTVTHGIISAKERGQVSLGSTIRIKEFLQTDAAINPGSSGGPLVNLDGEVIGVNTAIASHSGSNAGVAFSIPINMVKRIASQLLEKGSVSRGYLGAQMAQTFEAADALKLGLDRVQGALVETVYPETPAEACGLKANDVVLQIDNVAIKNENHLINLISSLAPGQKVQVQVWRERKMITLTAVVGDWSANQGRFQPMK
jgi:S1-C subfamily serine protease